ncbi:DUF4407 domain-containing protein [Frankia gtarii]|uniref:DUF4407 domain-containing protein n=1 Tax=Frankia gtarii TaxID=2950102 RepID=UPI0021BEE480|nr:DUF4407 domain-containing protein [Frankia gtarii]
MSRFLLWLSGADREILGRLRHDRAKYVGVGSAVLTTAAMATVSSTFALRMALKLPIVVCLLVGLGWGLAIMALDRWLVASVQRQDHWYLNALLMLPRLVLAILIGLVISTPLVLRIFQPEIDTEIAQMHAEDAAAFEQRITTDPRNQELIRLRAQRDALVRVGTTGVDVSTDPEVAPLQKQMDGLQTRLAQANADVLCESLGNCPGQQNKAGQGQQYNLKVSLRDGIQTQINQLQPRLTAAINAARARQQAGQSSATANAKDQLPALTSQITALETGQRNDRAAFNRQNSDNTGLLIRMEALDRITSDPDHRTLANAHLVLLLFITAIECLPILVKFLMSLGKLTTYEQVVAIEERNQLIAEEEMSARRRATMLLDDQDSYLEAQVTRDEKDPAIERLARRTVAVQEEVANAALDAWRDRELGRIHDSLDDYVATAPPPGTGSLQVSDGPAAWSGRTRGWETAVDEPGVQPDQPDQPDRPDRPDRPVPPNRPPVTPTRPTRPDLDVRVPYDEGDEGDGPTLAPDYEPLTTRHDPPTPRRETLPLPGELAFPSDDDRRLA